MDGMKMTALSSYGKLSQRISSDRQFGERNRGRGALKSVFAVPKKARTVKPFVDHVISFLIVDGKILLHNSLANGELNASPDSLLWAALACEWFPCGPVALRRPQGGEALGGRPPGSQSRGACVKARANGVDDDLQRIRNRVLQYKALQRATNDDG
ncbi:hypothetical protein PGTUg99_007934 [Puccinia graminis f. sp. tritici]|uniref:Uncharacterized protein n=1 Tax=Puccinia graminis f. sp. tritici TaxID=56615 RepID=A0A5B0PNM0_PUCGR|nr:hypothetical protein PGTUg99_007934 [Puccinia graminis f. sp. tritici]